MINSEKKLHTHDFKKPSWGKNSSSAWWWMKNVFLTHGCVQQWTHFNQNSITANPYIANPIWILCLPDYFCFMLWNIFSFWNMQLHCRVCVYIFSSIDQWMNRQCHYAWKYMWCTRPKGIGFCGSWLMWGSTPFFDISDLHPEINPSNIKYMTQSTFSLKALNFSRSDNMKSKGGHTCLHPRTSYWPKSKENHKRKLSCRQL